MQLFLVKTSSIVFQVKDSWNYLFQYSRIWSPSHLMRIIIATLPIANQIDQPIGSEPAHKGREDDHDDVPMTSYDEGKAATREISQVVDRNDLEITTETLFNT